ncbi:MAG: thioredoxin family protein [Candidatus Marinimicrobia bacterium]|nr:thioredoxin family protein [Candidatus Neomarinimicrobiota bacterium]
MKMIKLFKFIPFFLISGLLLSADSVNNVEYTFSIDRADIRAGETMILSADIHIEKGYHIYASHPDLTLTPSYFEWMDTTLFSSLGIMNEPTPIVKFVKTFNMDVGKHINGVILSQELKIADNVKPGNYDLEGTFIFQVCDVTKCIPHWDDFTITLSVENGPARSEFVREVVTEYPPLDSNKSDNISNDLSSEEESDESLFAFFFMALFAGLAALLTPCVFPMIPMTVAFFTGHEKGKSEAIRDASIFGFSIVAIYTIVGIGVSLLFGAEVANDLATSAIANIIFFIIFFIFALSFLGAFEIVLPSSFVNKMNKNADKGGLIGIFFMAFTLVLVSFSCTGPIVGSVLIESAQGELLKPIIGMLGFSLAFAVPFTLFAIFPEWMQSLPKSGGWLNSVKVVLGFLELALGIKFLSIADQTYHWGILDREIYLAIWIVIFFLMGIYLLGKLQLAHDSPIEKLSVTRLLLSICTFTFVIYMIPGMFGAPLKALSGYLPPMTSQDFDINRLIREQQFSSGNGMVEDENFPSEPRFSSFLHLPHGMNGFFEYNEALEYARVVNKPLFIDFTGHGCVNCRKMEEYVWADTGVLSRMKNDYVVVALYVDDKTTLPEDEWFTSTYDGKLKKTLGKQNFDLQIGTFNSNAQPYYVLLDNDENLLSTPRAYDLDIDKFIDFLDDGKRKFEEIDN